MVRVDDLSLSDGPPVYVEDVTTSRDGHACEHNIKKKVRTYGRLPLLERCRIHPTNFAGPLPWVVEHAKVDDGWTCRSRML